MSDVTCPQRTAVLSRVINCSAVNVHPTIKKFNSAEISRRERRLPHAEAMIIIVGIDATWHCQNGGVDSSASSVFTPHCATFWVLWLT